MVNIPRWLQLLGVGLVVGVGGTTYVFVTYFNKANVNPTPIPSASFNPLPLPGSPSASSIPPQDLQTINILVRDSKSDLPLSDVEVEIVFKEEILRERTSDLGSLKVQIPKQKLGDVSISLRKAGYKSINRRVLNFSVDPEKMRPLYLEPEALGNPANPDLGYEPKAIISIKKPTFQEGEPIEVEYSGLPGKHRDLIVLVDSSQSEKELSGLEKRDNIGTKGVITFDGLQPGNYEIRAYYNYREGNNHRLIGRQPFDVK